MSNSLKDLRVQIEALTAEFNNRQNAALPEIEEKMQKFFAKLQEDYALSDININVEILLSPGGVWNDISFSI